MDRRDKLKAEQWAKTRMLIGVAVALTLAVAVLFVKRTLAGEMWW